MIEMNPRFSFGGDEHLFVEVSEAMSLDAFFIGISVTEIIKAEKQSGITEICPANASFQLRFNPDVIAPTALLDYVKSIFTKIDDKPKVLNTRIIDIPVFYEDPWTHETLMRFRERHQDPKSTDIAYAAQINGYQSVAEFIEAHSATPWFVSMVGFVAGLPFMYQMVEQSKQIQVPKYLIPRTDTPKQTVGYGGCFSCIYSVRGAGGYQMFGITPAPIYEPAQRLPYLSDFMILFKPGDIVRFCPINRKVYDEMLNAVEEGSFSLDIHDVTFDLSSYQNNPKEYIKTLVGV